MHYTHDTSFTKHNDGELIYKSYESNGFLKIQAQCACTHSLNTCKMLKLQTFACCRRYQLATRSN